jgi:hypothetical protein
VVGNGNKAFPYASSIKCYYWVMSFTFKWPRFSEQFHADAIQMLNAALNKGNKPPVIADRIEVVELEMGLQVYSLFRSLRRPIK